jgi:hypothetical protein
MWNNYWTFLDYLELRRRIEKRLAGGKWLLLHTALFFAAVLFFTAMRPPPPYYFDYYIQPGAGYFMVVWSLLLAAHGLLTYVRSGGSASRRGQAIEAEMRERIQNDDTYLSDDPKDLFRLHGILDDDIGKRSSSVSLLTIYTTINAMLWIPWAIFDGASDSFAWTASPIMLIFIFLPLLGFSAFSSAGRERKLRQQMENSGEPMPAIPKQKRAAHESAMRLSDDGELIMIEDEMEQPKSKRR